MKNKPSVKKTPPGRYAERPRRCCGAMVTKQFCPNCGSKSPPMQASDDFMMNKAVQFVGGPLNAQVMNICAFPSPLLTFYRKDVADKTIKATYRIKGFNGIVLVARYVP